MMRESFEYFLGQAQELGRLYRTVRELYFDDPALVEIMKQTAPGFFNEILEVYADSIALSMARLCDKASDGRRGRKNMSVPRYLEDIKGQGKATDLLCSTAEAVIAISDRVELPNLRHRYLAHNDELSALEEHSFRVPQWEEVGEFVSILEKFVFEAARILGIEYSRQLMARTSTRHVLLLKKHLIATQKNEVTWSHKENFRAPFYKGRIEHGE